jgi:hypothetical protein
VAAHGGVPPPGPLLRVLHVEFIVPRPRFSFVGGQKILVGRGIFLFSEIRLEYRSRFFKQNYKFVQKLSKQTYLSKVREYRKISFGIKF